MLFLKKISFWLALIGLVSAGELVLRLRATITEPVPPPPVTPPAKPFARAIGASGLVEALRENTSVGVPSGGLVTRVHVAVWQKVKAGEPLLELDARELQATLSTQRAQVEVYSAMLTKTRDQVARLKGVDDVRAISLEDLRNREAEVKVAEAQLVAAEAAVAQTEVLIDRLIVRAPIEGAVLQVNVRAGEYLSPGAPTAPLVIGEIAEVQVRVDIDEQLAPRVRPGQRAVGFIKGAPERPIEMTFVRIEPYVVPKRSLTGASIERVDTRVLQVIYRFTSDPAHPVYVGQQMDLYIEE